MAIMFGTASNSTLCSSASSPCRCFVCSSASSSVRDVSSARLLVVVPSLRLLVCFIARAGYFVCSGCRARLLICFIVGVRELCDWLVQRCGGSVVVHQLRWRSVQSFLGLHVIGGLLGLCGWYVQPCSCLFFLLELPSWQVLSFSGICSLHRLP